MVAAIYETPPASSTTTSDTHTKTQSLTPPLLPSHQANGFHQQQRRPKGRPVSSRYMSPSTSTTSTSNSTPSSSSTRRFPSPLVSKSANSMPMRSKSVEKRRGGAKIKSLTPIHDSRQGNNNNNNNAGDVVSEATKLLVNSTKSLSVSFQGEAFSLPIRKAPAVSNARNRWPARNRQVNLVNSVNLSSDSELSMSVDCDGSDRKRIVGNGCGKVVRALKESMVEGNCGRRVSFDGGLSLDLGKVEVFKAAKECIDGNSVNEGSLPCDLNMSDTDSVSSGSTLGAQDGVGGVGGGGRDSKLQGGPRGSIVSARFWQETNSRLRRLQDSGSPLLMSPGSRNVVPGKVTQLRRLNSDGTLSSSRTMASPIRGSARLASPNKLWASALSSPSRGMPSPSRVRGAVASSIDSNAGGAPSILSFSVDLRRGKIGEDRIFDAHTLRLLYNRSLQWRFINAMADATLKIQKLNAEKHLWNAWLSISELRHKVILKRIKLLLLRQKLKITAILKGQMPYLEEWALLDKDHYSSLLGATEALRASTLRLPVAEKAMADVSNLKDVVGSAVDVMQAMASSIYSLMSKVEETNSLVVELVKVTKKEKFLLEQCKDFLSSLAAMQVKDCSLRTHVLQLFRVPTSSCLTTLCRTDLILTAHSQC